MNQEKELGDYGVNEETEETDKESIRIRSLSDLEIFEHEDEEDEEDYSNFSPDLFPEVELTTTPTSISRKRKQELCSFTYNLEEMPEVLQEYKKEIEETNSFNFQMRTFPKRSRMPLYALNPDDFHDHGQKLKIRRAYVTFRHHQRKKEQIALLTEENGQLRDLVAHLKSKVCQLSQCGCKENARADLSILDRVILRTKFVPTFTHDGPQEQSVGPTLPRQVPSREAPIKKELGMETSETATVSTFPPKPLINITASRLAKLMTTCPVSSSSVNVVTRELPKPRYFHAVEKRMDSTKPLESEDIQHTRTKLRNISERITADGPRFIPITPSQIKIDPKAAIISQPQIKIEPKAEGILEELSVNQKMVETAFNGGDPKTTTATPLFANLKTNIVCSQTSAATAPVSRIVFAKKGNQNFTAKETALQIFSRVMGTSSLSEEYVTASQSKGLKTASQIWIKRKNDGNAPKLPKQAQNRQFMLGNYEDVVFEETD